MKPKVLWSFLLLGVVALLAGCAPAAKQAPLQECVVTLDTITLVRAGADHVVIAPLFSVSNPNSYEVMISDITYRLDTGQGMVVYDQFPGRYYIPAGEKIQLAGTGYLAWSELVADKMAAGIAAAAAAGQALPFWKGVGGKTPAGVTPAIWGSIEAKPVTYSYEFAFRTAGGGSEKYAIARGTWPAK